MSKSHASGRESINPDDIRNKAQDKTAHSLFKYVFVTLMNSFQLMFCLLLIIIIIFAYMKSLNNESAYIYIYLLIYFLLLNPSGFFLFV